MRVEIIRKANQNDDDDDDDDPGVVGVVSGFLLVRTIWYRIEPRATQFELTKRAAVDRCCRCCYR